MSKSKAKITLHSGYKKNIIVVFSVCELIVSLLKLGVINLLGKAIDCLISERRVDTSGLVCTVLFAVCFVATTRIYEICKSRYQKELIQRESELFFGKYRGSKSSTAKNTSDRLQILNESIPSVVNTLTNDIPKFYGTALALIVYIIYGLYIHIFITVLVSVIACVITVYQYKSSQKNTADYEEGEKLEAKSNEYARKVVENAEIAEVMLDSEKITRKAKTNLGNLNDVWIRAMKVFFKSTGVGTGAYHMTGFITIGFGVVEVIRGNLLFGNIYVIFQIAQIIMSYIAAFPQVYQRISQIAGTNQFMKEFWEQEQWDGERSVRQIARINLKNVSVYYGNANEELVLRDISAEFECGKMYVIHGGNGAGKSTLAKTIGGILKIQKGSICADNIPIVELEKQSYLSAVKYCGQDTVFFPGTVLENITGSEDNEAEVKQILADIGCRLCEELSERLHEEMGMTKGKFSAGERQMIAFVRAVYGIRPSFLILDESIANMDSQSQKSVLRYLEKLSENGTGIIFITHNQIADNLPAVRWKLAEGRLFEEGQV